jgi:voltage-gated sodium channel
VFSGLFAVEAILKLTVYGSRYFKDKWNVFDFLVLVLSIGALSLYSASVKLGSAITVIRAFRLQ